MNLFKKKDCTFLYKGKKVKIVGSEPKIKCTKSIDDFDNINDFNFKSGNIYYLSPNIKGANSDYAPYRIIGDGLDIYIGKFKNAMLDSHFELIEDNNVKVLA